MKKILFLCFCCLLALACSNDKRYAPKEGRLSVFEAKVPVLAKGSVTLAKQETVTSWENPFYNLQNKLPNLTQNEPQKQWRESIGNSSDFNRLIATPIVTNEAIYTLDGNNTLTKFNLSSGERLWQVKENNDKKGLSLAFSNKKIFTLSSDGLVTAFDEDGKQLWQKDFETATRAPLIADKYALYLITAHNQFIVLNPKTGAEIWRYQTSLPQTLLSNMAPIAKSKGVVVVPFTTGEAIGFDADSGLLLWIQMMVGNRPQDLTEVPQIAAAPVIEGDTVYLTGHANFSGAYALKTGETKWTVNFGSTLTPIVNGNTLFMMTTQNELVALDKRTGKAFWLKEYKSEDHPWQSLSLINNELVLSDGTYLLYVNPQDGSQIRTEKQDLNTLPIVVNGRLITIDHKPKLTVY